MQFTEYATTQFNGLMTFGEARTLRAETPDESLWLLGKVICDFNLEDQVGVTLLHKHFDLKENEQLVRRYQNNEGVMQPEPPSSENIPCIVGLADVHKGELQAFEFGDPKCNPPAIANAQVLLDNQSFLQEIADVALQQNVAHLFGLATLYGINLFDMPPTETLLEYRSSDRVLTLKRHLLSELGDMEIEQTLWRFSKKQTEGTLACPVSVPEGDNEFLLHCWHSCPCHCPGAGGIGCG